MELSVDGRPLSDPSATLQACGVSENDLLVLRHRAAPTASSISGWDSISVPAHAAEQQSGVVRQQLMALRERLRSDPYVMSSMRENNPQLAEAVMSDDLDRFAHLLQAQVQAQRHREAEERQLAAADPFDPDVQRRIEERIRQERINENMEAAMEYSPESFGTVHMLYVQVAVNGVAVKAFIDSGAQMTIMSQACAERCNILHLVDRRWAGIARGVGEANIIGRIHMAQVEISGSFFPCAFAVMEKQDIDLLLGLDMLRRHQCCIDLRRNVLIIGTTASETPFLAEHELPAHARRRSTEPAAASADAAQLESQAPAPRRADPQLSTPAADPSTAAARSAPSRTADEPIGGASSAAVAELVAMGFRPEHAAAALRATQGNVSAAITLLLAASSDDPPHAGGAASQPPA